jgi:hypothetical protein
MKATRAYIASLGTAGVLVASSALMLVVVSALVAFNAWPGGDPMKGLKGLVVGDNENSLKLSGPALVAANAAPAAGAVAAGPPAAAAGQPTTGGPGGGLANPLRPPSGGAPTPGQPSRPPSGTTAPAPARPPSTLPATPGPPNVEEVSRGLGGTVEQVTGDLGKTVGGVNPQLGQGVSDTGKALSEIVQGIGGKAQQGLEPLRR